MNNKSLVQRLNKITNSIKYEIINMIYLAQSGHPGGSLSAASIISVLYFHVMRIDPKSPQWDDRDRFILSKGHACPVLYAALALRGFFPREDLSTLRQLNSSLQGHPDMRKTRGVDMTTGSLGQGLSVGIGMALGAKLDNKDYRVYVMLGDGELDEGQVWEAAMFAAKYKLNNILVIIDCNKLQIDGTTEKVMPLEPLVDKWKAFRWNVVEVNGHNVDEILTAMKKFKLTRNMPTVIIAHTVKGKGVSFMENNPDWHGRVLNKQEYEQAIKEISGEKEKSNEINAY